MSIKCNLIFHQLPIQIKSKSSEVKSSRVESNSSQARERSNVNSIECEKRRGNYDAFFLGIEREGKVNVCELSKGELQLLLLL